LFARKTGLPRLGEAFLDSGVEEKVCKRTPEPKTVRNQHTTIELGGKST